MYLGEGERGKIRIHATARLVLLSGPKAQRAGLVAVLILLEDDPGRAELMQRLAVSDLGLAVVHYDNAPDMVGWLRDHLHQAALIALDHDLGASRIRDGQRFDPGVGRQVVDFLAER